MTTDHLEYINKVVMTGYVVRDPEFRHTTTGTPVSNFRIAATKRYHDPDGKPREEVCYVGVAAWHNLAEECKKLLTKGSAIQVEGELKSRVRESGDGVRRSFVEIRASRIRVFKSEGDYLDLEDSGELATIGAAHHGRGVAEHIDDAPFHMSEARHDQFEAYNTDDREEL
jgi:single-strand DNA-binding protein